MSGRRRALPGTHRRGGHRAPRPRRRRVPVGARTVALLTVGAVALGFGPRLPGALAPGDDATRATGEAAQLPAAVGGDSRAAGPEATDVPEGTTSRAERPPVRASERSRQRAPRARTVPDDGPGTFRVAAAGGDPGRGAEDATYGELTYTVEVEDGVPFDPTATGRRVERVLEHRRSWQGLLGQPLRRTTGVPDFRVLVASPGTTDALCAPLQTLGQVSCRNGDLVVLNAVRWAEGIPDYEGALAQYRTYLVNHEVGHRLGQGHVECPGAGRPAPVMQQQTYGLDGCTRNAWPAPAGAAG
ncbi:DUF3152 domain-containing protein [Nocardioides sp. CFH 31398]|uniref:DUF3152 domain-containing protein n=1 Tax=Nocardioides sp. CFH 31398 TaxID=2919579 RepID=UPI001F058EB0|nr:DUF3152 domain-containing protein [Nocardioides sp. CFH 31398]MCH1865780.1 DUF3152 domain-containing protein [Nocardioides sp. CFH 31398]